MVPHPFALSVLSHFVPRRLFELSMALTRAATVLLANWIIVIWCDLKIKMYWNILERIYIHIDYILHAFVIFCPIVACLAVKKQFLKGRVDGIKVQANFAKEREERGRTDALCLTRQWYQYVPIPLSNLNMTMQVECKCIQGHLSYQIPVPLISP